MAAVGVKLAGQQLGNDVRNLLCRKPRHYFIADSPVCGTILRGQDMLVKWSQHDEDIIVPLAQRLDGSLEGVPLE